jgi:hypothetical protein
MASLHFRSSPLAGWPRVALLTALFTLALMSSVDATVVVPLSEESLAQDADAIVIGRVTMIQPRYEPQKRAIFTHITVGVEEVLKGDVPVADITLRQPGGTVGDLSSWIIGSPNLAFGEKVLLFLRRDRDAVLRVAHLYQGKFTIVVDPATGEEYASRAMPPGVRSPHLPAHAPAAGVGLEETHRLRDLTTRIRDHLRRAPHRQAEAESSLTLNPGDNADAELGAIQAEFSFMGPARWFEPDTGNPVTMKINSLGEPRAPTNGLEQVRQAFQAWSSVSGASFLYADGGPTDSVGFQGDGVNAVSFGDPLGDMGPPVGCTGTLALGGFFYTSSQTRTVGGTAFWRILEGDLVFNDGWAGCGFYENFANFAEVATHELGHVLGLDHSSDSSATMYYMAHFDARGATLRPDDMDGLRAIYPGVTLTVTLAGSGSGTVFSTPGGVTCGSDCTQGYGSGVTVTLTATPASGSIFTGWSGDCTGTGACVLTMNGARSITATFQRTAPSDLLWHNAVTGQVYAWHMNGGTQKDGQTLGVVTDTSWRLVAAWDFNADGKADLLWENTMTGDVYVWFMNGTTVTASTYVTRGMDLAWKIAAVGDLNGDGKADLLWENTTTGDVYVWFMNGTSVASGTYVARGMDPLWTVVGAGDFNGDGKADLLWHHQSTGQVYVSYMTGATVTGGQTLGTVADTAWRLVGAGDFNGDGKADLLWHHQSTGQVYVWYMTGATVTGGRTLGTVADTAWRLVGAGNLTP